MGYIALYLTAFIVMQVLAQLAMKFGSIGTTALRSRRWWLGFALANGIGMPSVLFLNELYGAFPASPSLVAAVVLAISFLAIQVALVAVFRLRLKKIQYVGIAMIAVGTVLACLGVK